MKIAVIGLGYIGFSTAVWFSKARVEVVGTDIDEEKVALINSGQVPMNDIEPVLPERFWEATPIKATTDWCQLVYDDTIDAFFIAVPTERDGKPWWNPLKDVVGKLVTGGLNPLVIIESTMAVGTVDSIVRKHLDNIVVAPRRDWFTEPTRNLKTLPRIVGGTTPEVTKRAIEILSVVCDTLLPCTYREAELVKAYENSYRHLTCVLAQQMAHAYPNMNIRKVLELGGTKWNIESMYANATGTGGYCLALAPQYVLQGAENPSALTLLIEALNTDNTAVNIFKNLKDYKVGCLGLAYMGNIKVHVLSPLMRILNALPELSIKVNDPLYTDDEIVAITGCETFRYPDDLDKFEVILLLAGHDQYRDTSELTRKTENCRFIFDNTGLWKNISFKCPYYLSGQPGWMNFSQDLE